MVENKRKKHHDKDKYYRLAKEQGLRSRAAFKLTQINRKFGLLEKCQTAVLDLCAAPGGWTQIAARTCPKHCRIISVDIVPIRSLAQQYPNVTCLIGDITTEKCKQDIHRAMAASGVSSSTSSNKSSNAGAVDLVLHDGAPNIGAEYGKDAYEQNELALHAVKCAVQHLKAGTGVFVTKLYRSRDYASFLWMLQQLFQTVTAMKPAASRSQSAEIFVICEQYKAPAKLDPKLLDPKYIFESVAGDSTGGTMTAGQAQLTLSIFDKNRSKQRRQRGGYDMDHLDATMRHTESVVDFVRAESMSAAIQILSRSTGLCFTCETCLTVNQANKQSASSSSNSCSCQFLLHHPLTTTEVKESVTDLQVLNKSDFKAMLAWRTQMAAALQELKQQQEEEKEQGSSHKSNKLQNGGGTASSDDDGDNDDAVRKKTDSDGDNDDDDSEREEIQILSEIEQLKQRRARERKRETKKEREAQAKHRRRAALGMDLNAIDIAADQDNLFSLATLQTAHDLERASEVNLDRQTDEEIFGKKYNDNDDDDIVVVGMDGREKSVADLQREEQEEGNELEDADARRERLLLQRERDLDEAYQSYLTNTKNIAARTKTKMAKRSKKLQRLQCLQEVQEDLEMAGTTPAEASREVKAYAKLLTGKKGSDSDSEDDDDDDDDGDDDGFHDDPMTPEEYAAAKPAKKKQKITKSNDEMDGNGKDVVNAAAVKAAAAAAKNPLIHVFDEPASAKTARWFSNPLFESIGKAAAETAVVAAAAVRSKSSKKRSATDKNKFDDESDSESNAGESEDDDMDMGSNSSSNDEEETKGKDEKGGRKKKVGLDADEVLAMMPKTDKQKRHEKRLKQMAREERKKQRRSKKLGDLESEFELAPAAVDSSDDDDDDENNNEKLKDLSEAKRKKLLEARNLIKAGFGKIIDNKIAGDDDVDNINNTGIEIVSKEESDRIGKRPLPVADERKYDSEHEDYDSDDYATTLALGTMMLRRSKEKALVDASYNRYAWNDPEGLPDWFVDDEAKYYRPQLPIPPALLEKIKSKQLALSTKPIKKVAEARARKSKRARMKLAAAKKQAEAVANSNDMSEAMKLKAISKALRGQEAKKPGKTYVVAQKGRGTRAGKGVKLVDKRMKNDKRAEQRSEKKQKKGKQNKLVGSKRRRHHS